MSVRVVAAKVQSSSRVGAVLHSPRRYDWLVWLRTLGRERVLRERMLSLARMQSGESVLDVGCGTGTLAIAAKRRVGPTGRVAGVDASAEMIARAGRKAVIAGTAVTFDRAAAQALPFGDAQFDVVLSTLMFHHLPHKGREACAREMRRVLKPGGRVLLVDFRSVESARTGLLAHFHRHGHTAPNEILAVFASAGLNPIETGSVGSHDLQFVLATSRAAASEGDTHGMEHGADNAHG